MPEPKPVPELAETVGIVGTGTIAEGLSRVVGAHTGPVVVARSSASAQRLDDRLSREPSTAHSGARRPPRNMPHITVDPEDLSECSVVVEAVAEDLQIKTGLLAQLHETLSETGLILTTTSSLGVETLARASGRPDRFAAFHPFNPVDRMRTVELCFPTDASETTRRRVEQLALALDKDAVTVPDRPGFVVNRLLFPYLLDAVNVMEQQGLAPEDVDRCMAGGAGHPMGPLALLDLVGLDVAEAIAASLTVEVPARLAELVRDGRLGRKSGHGFYTYG